MSYKWVCRITTVLLVLSLTGISTVFAEDQCDTQESTACATCNCDGTCTDCDGTCDECYLDEWWTLERYIGDEMVDQMAIHPKKGDCAQIAMKRDNADYSIEMYIVNYPLKENAMQLDLASSTAWFKGEIPDYGAIFVKQIDPDEHWVFRFGDRVETATMSFNPAATHTYRCYRIVDGSETLWNETSISEGSFATMCFNEEPVIILATTGSENTKLPDDLAAIEWLVFDCGKFGIVYVAARDDIDAFEIEIEGTRYYAS